VALFAYVEGLTRGTGPGSGLAIAAKMTAEVTVCPVEGHGNAAVLALLDMTAIRAKHSGIEASPV
jgi:hypothetical protein